MIQPSGSNYQPVTSHDQIYQALTNAEMNMEEYGVSQSKTAQDLTGLQGNIAQREQTEAHHFMGLAKKDAKAMQIALGVGAVMTFIGGAAMNYSEFGGPDTGDPEVSLAKAQGLNDKMMVAGSISSSLGEEATSVTHAVSQASTAKAKGKLTQTQTAASLSQQIAKRAQKQQVAALKAGTEEMGYLADFISGQTSASSTELFRG